MVNWYKITKEAGKEEFLLKQQPSNMSTENWATAVKWAISISNKHAVWLARLIAKNPNEFRFGEDDQKVTETLNLFERVKNRPEFTQKDINGYKTYSALVRAVEPFSEKGGSREERRDARKGGIKKIDEINGYSLFKILNFDGAHWVSQGTQWCISQEKFYNDYSKEGPIYFFSYADDPYALYHAESGQFKDVYDDPVKKVDVLPLMDLLNKHYSLLKLDADEPDNIRQEIEPDIANVIGIFEVIENKKRMYSQFDPNNPPHMYNNLIKTLDYWSKNITVQQMNIPKDEDGSKEEEPALVELAYLYQIRDSLPEGMYEKLSEVFIDIVKERIEEWIDYMHKSMEIGQQIFADQHNKILERLRLFADYFSTLPIDIRNRLREYVDYAMEMVMARFFVNLKTKNLLTDTNSVITMVKMYEDMKELRNKEITKEIKNLVDKGIEENDKTAIYAHYSAHKNLRGNNLSNRAWDAWKNITQKNPFSTIFGFYDYVSGSLIRPTRLNEEQQKELEISSKDNFENHLNDRNMKEILQKARNNVSSFLKNFPVENIGPKSQALLYSIVSSMTLRSFDYSFPTEKLQYLMKNNTNINLIITNKTKTVLEEYSKLRDLDLSTLKFYLPMTVMEKIDSINKIVEEFFIEKVDYSFVKRIINDVNYENSIMLNDFPQFKNSKILYEKCERLMAQVIIKEGAELFGKSYKNYTRTGWGSRSSDAPGFLELVIRKVPQLFKDSQLIKRAVGILEVKLQKEEPENFLAHNPSSEKGINRREKLKKIIIEELNDKSVFEESSPKFLELYKHFSRDEDVRNIVKQKIESTDINASNVLDINPVLIKDYPYIKKLVNQAASETLGKKLEENILHYKPEIDKVIFNIFEQQMPYLNELKKKYDADFELVKQKNIELNTLIENDVPDSHQRISQIRQDLQVLDESLKTARNVYELKRKEIFEIVKSFQINVTLSPVNLSQFSNLISTKFNPVMAYDLAYSSNAKEKIKRVISHYLNVLEGIYPNVDERIVTEIIMSIFGVNVGFTKWRNFAPNQETRKDMGQSGELFAQ